MKLKPLRRLFLPKLELGWGGTGNLPVPLGHRPNGTDGNLALETADRKSWATIPIPSGGSPLGTGRWPVPPVRMVAAVLESVFIC